MSDSREYMMLLLSACTSGMTRRLCKKHQILVQKRMLACSLYQEGSQKKEELNQP